MNTNKNNNIAEEFEKNIRPHATPTRLFQAWVDKDLLEQVIEQRKKDKLSWRNLIESCFMLYLKISKQ